MTGVFLQKKPYHVMPAVATIVATATSPATTFAVPPLRAQTAPGGATIAQMSGHTFAQATYLTNVCKTSGAGVSLSMGIHAKRGAMQ